MDRLKSLKKISKKKIWLIENTIFEGSYNGFENGNVYLSFDKKPKKQKTMKKTRKWVMVSGSQVKGYIKDIQGDKINIIRSGDNYSFWIEIKKLSKKDRSFVRNLQYEGKTFGFPYESFSAKDKTLIEKVTRHNEIMIEWGFVLQEQMKIAKEIRKRSRDNY